MEISWSEFKKILDLNNKNFIYVTIGNNYYLTSRTLECLLPINDSTDTVDFETHYKNFGNILQKPTVLTEPANISLTLYQASDVVEINAGEQATIDIEIEQQAQEQHQILYGGALYAENPSFSDYIQFQIVDINNVLGYGAGLVLKEYIKKAYLNNQNTFEDYDDAGAYLPVGLFLRAIYKSEKESGTTKVKINILLGIPS